MRKNLLILLLIIFLIPIVKKARAENVNAARFSGKIFLQVESKGEAWYVLPNDQKRYFLGRPSDAFEMMKKFGLGITSENLKKIPIGLSKYPEKDSDNDGLPDSTETAIGTDPEKSDSDNDGYDDKTEIQTNYNPAGAGKIVIDANLSNRLSGKILLQVESRGEAWYINPLDKKRYLLGSPTQAFNIIRMLGIGIKNTDLLKIDVGILSIPEPVEEDEKDEEDEPEITTACGINTGAYAVIGLAAEAIRKYRISDTLSCFTPEMAKSLEYTLNYLPAEDRLTLGNILSGSSLAETKEDELKYTNQIYFSLGGYNAQANFYVKKQADGSWKLTNL